MSTSILIWMVSDMAKLRCQRCGCVLAEDDSGMTEIKRSGLSIRAYGIDTMTASCPLCALNKMPIETIFTRTSGQFSHLTPLTKGV